MVSLPIDSPAFFRSRHYHCSVLYRTPLHAVEGVGVQWREQELQALPHLRPVPRGPVSPGRGGYQEGAPRGRRNGTKRSSPQTKRIETPRTRNGKNFPAHETDRNSPQTNRNENLRRPNETNLPADETEPISPQTKRNETCLTGLAVGLTPLILPARRPSVVLGRSTLALQ